MLTHSLLMTMLTALLATLPGDVGDVDPKKAAAET